MQTLTIELIGTNSLEALEELEQKQLIRIVKKVGLDSYALPGEAINEDDFKKWVEYAENSPTVSKSEARHQWAEQKKKLRKLIR